MPLPRPISQLPLLLHLNNTLIDQQHQIITQLRINYHNFPPHKRAYLLRQIWLFYLVYYFLAWSSRELGSESHSYTVVEVAHYEEAFIVVYYAYVAGERI